MIAEFIYFVTSEFAMTDLDFRYFLGIEFTKTSKGLFFSYIVIHKSCWKKLKWWIVICKPLGTPIIARDISSEFASEYENVSMYRMMVGSLQYLIITRPDIAFGVNSIC